jgi:uncharacterized protein
MTMEKINDLAHTIHEIKHYLPSQTPIKDFIHHNSLHAYQHLKFYDAIFQAQKTFGYQVSLPLADFRKLHESGRIKSSVIDKMIVDRFGEKDLASWREKMLAIDPKKIEGYDDCHEPRIGRLRSAWKNKYAIELENEVQPLLFRLLSSYLDQGIALQKFPVHADGLMASIRQLERNNTISLFSSSRVKMLLQDEDLTLVSLLEILVGDTEYYDQYIYDQAFSHPGWSGLISAIEDAPHTLMDGKKVSLEDFMILECLMEIDALDKHVGKWQAISQIYHEPSINIFETAGNSTFQDVIRLWQEAFEWSYYDDVLMAFVKAKKSKPELPAKTFQAIFCIDERECSLRRHVESVDANAETLGAPGFFGVEFYFQPEHGQFYEKLCPAPVTPKYLIKEVSNKDTRPHDAIYTNKYTSILGGTWRVFAHGLWAIPRMMQMLFRPKMSAAISNAYVHMLKENELVIENTDPTAIENELQLGFKIEEMAARVEGVLKGTGLVKDFAPIVYAVAHGSSSANNPHHSAHDCGACSGRPGSANARVFAFMANHKGVRAILASKGILIPETTQFIGGMHDTSADVVDFYDEHFLSEENKQLNKINMASFEKALDLNAKERSRRFASIDTQGDLTHVRQAILDRSVSMFEPRPELGHGTNSLCVVGRRHLTQGIFLDRRSFLNSYDPTIDPEGNILTNVMKPIGLVCGGINLEYYFSRVDNYKLGAGTKLPHNVVGLVGVANSTDGDLRPGLPLQMIEVHVRLLVIVEHRPEIVHKAIQSAPEIYEWYLNEWVHIVAIDPDTHQLHYFRDGAFSEYYPSTGNANEANDILSVITSAKEMKTNYIVDATKENLAPQVLSN